MNPKNKLAEMPVRPLLYTMAVPLMLSLLIQSLYNIVDSIFVARLSETALTAASLVYAIQFLMIAIGVGTAVGDTVLSMVSLIIGAVVNIILDPIMIFGLLGCPAMGIRGAAIATVIGNVVGAGYYIVYFLKGSSSLSISLKDFSAKEKVASGVLAIGVPAALGNLLMSLSSIIMNSQMAKYGDTHEDQEQRCSHKRKDRPDCGSVKAASGRGKQHAGISVLLDCPSNGDASRRDRRSAMERY